MASLSRSVASCATSSSGRPRGRRSSSGVAERDAQPRKAASACPCPRCRRARAARPLRARSGLRPVRHGPRASSAAPSCAASPRGTSRRRIPSRQSCTAVSIASGRARRAAPGSRLPPLTIQPERRPEELRLGHEAEEAPREERHPERPGIEARGVVGGEDVPTRRRADSRPRRPSAGTARGAPGS